MIVSHEHKFIFVKTRKTAGTSIEISLSRYCGKNDIISPITLADEPLRGTFGVSAQNYLSDGSHKNSGFTNFLRVNALKLASKIELWRPRTIPHRIRKGLSRNMPPPEIQGKGFYNHMPAQEIVDLIGERTWNDYFKFCIEREPISKVVSDYHYRAADEKSFDQYLLDGPLPTDFEKYSLNGEIAVDKIGRFENLDQDLKEIGDKIGIPFYEWLPRAKGGSKKSTEKVELTSNQKDEVRRLFAREYQAIGWE